MVGLHLLAQLVTVPILVRGVTEVEKVDAVLVSRAQAAGGGWPLEDGGGAVLVNWVEGDEDIVALQVIVQVADSVDEGQQVDQLDQHIQDVKPGGKESNVSVNEKLMDVRTCPTFWLLCPTFCAKTSDIMSKEMS